MKNPAEIAAESPGLARALWVVEPGRAELREEALPEPESGQALVQARFSGISRGTEALVFRGGVPEALHEAMRCPHQAGSLALPVKYGYCSVGVVQAGPESLLGKRVFCLHPHQDRYVVPAESLVPIPDEVPDARAVLAANMETAVNALWDAAPPVGGRIAVIGAGAVGLLSASLLSQIPGVELQVLDIDPARDELALALGLACVRPDAAARDCDLVLHASGTGAGLTRALDLAGFEGHIVELSWYGDREVPLPLGGRFHHARLRISSSQVGNVATAQRARWSYRRRMQLALRLLADARYDLLLGEPTDFVDLPRRMPEWLGAGAPAGRAVTQLVRYR